MDEREDPIEVRVMNDYGVEFPLWGHGGIGPEDPDEVGLSPQLTADLEALAARWEAHLGPGGSDDRFDRFPVLPALVDRWRRRRASADRAAAVQRWEAEAAAIKGLGEHLARRVQDELGPRYAVTYWG
ncbi:hypothetical protein [Aeromicrobium sp. IC_218]|uniref:hypothetical protein n=1 Tax=Aeromicrobium sp. IC_218 TaxID=2545468 RepID=UPI0010392C4C|nr:hypothetical protein [Aeromicrobium sp. IC_218]TCI98837.1 hypothetical protein E0W78_08775 [Aeromicrobium sp. IC_218]